MSAANNTTVAPPPPLPRISDRIVDKAAIDALQIREDIANRKATRARLAEIVAFISLIATATAATSTAIASIIHDVTRVGAAQ